MSRTALLFPGQGAQTVGMAGVLCGGLPAAKALFDRASAALGYDLLDVCVNGPAERLNATDVSQPAIFVASLAALEQLKAAEPDALPTVVSTAGLSLGEYTALVYAGAMTFDDGLKVVQARGRAMQDAAEATPSAMVSVLGLDIADIESLVIEARGADTLEIANYLCPGNTALSGSLAAIERIEQLAVQKGGIRTIRLAVAGAFHTNLMKPADEKLGTALAGVTISAPAVPVWSNVDGQPHTKPARNPQSARAASDFSRALGRDAARASGGWSRKVLRGWPWPCAGRAHETGEPEDRYPERDGLIAGSTKPEIRNPKESRPICAGVISTRGCFFFRISCFVLPCGRWAFLFAPPSVNSDGRVVGTAPRVIPLGCRGCVPARRVSDIPKGAAGSVGAGPCCGTRGGPATVRRVEPCPSSNA